MKSWLLNLALSAGSVLVMVGLFEGYLLLRYEREQSRLEQRYEGRSLCTRAHATLVYEFVPGACGFNQLGFADSEPLQHRPPQSYRIVVIGDSVAQGQGVRRSERFTTLLGNELQALFERPVEVLNLARTGYATGQQLEVLSREGLALEPDLVIWSYVLNDPAHPVFHDANGELGRFFFRPRWHGLHYVQRKLFEARENAQRDRCGTDEYHRLLHCAYRDQIAERIRNLGRLTADAEVPVLFAIHPVFVEAQDFEASYPLADIHQDLAQMATDAGLLTLDLTSAYAGQAPSSLNQSNPNWFDPWHPNPLGHQLVADSLLPAVKPLVHQR